MSAACPMVGAESCLAEGWLGFDNLLFQGCLRDTSWQCSNSHFLDLGNAPMQGLSGSFLLGSLCIIHFSDKSIPERDWIAQLEAEVAHTVFGARRVWYQKATPASPPAQRPNRQSGTSVQCWLKKCRISIPGGLSRQFAYV